MRGRPTAGQHGSISPVLRPVLWSALLSAVVAGALATPAYADPALPATVPNTGSRPVATGDFRLPGASAPVGGVTVPNVPQVNGPLAAQIQAQETELAVLGEQLLKLRQEHTTAQAELIVAQRERDVAAADLAVAQKAAEAAAAEAIKEAAALPPGTFGSDLHELGALSRLQRGRQSAADTSGPAWELSRARHAAEAAEVKFTAAGARAQTATTAYTLAQTTYQQKTAALLALKRQNADQLAVIERQQEAVEQQLGIGTGDAVGRAAHPRAMAAVRYALAQLGDPYLWAAEGPDKFDCSGLMWAAYRSKGADYYGLPRVSRDQYYATRANSVGRNALLPGDLLFFASGDSWTTIHHVGMYIGNGKMVHAPTTGDVVKISTVWWSRFYAATRVFGAVPGTSTPPPEAKPPADKPPAKPPASKPPATKPPATTPPPLPSLPPKPTTPPPPPPSTSPSPSPSPSPSTSSPTSEPSSAEPSSTTSAASTASSSPSAS